MLNLLILGFGGGVTGGPFAWFSGGVADVEIVDLDVCLSITRLGRNLDDHPHIGTSARIAA